MLTGICCVCTTEKHGFPAVYSTCSYQDCRQKCLLYRLTFKPSNTVCTYCKRMVSFLKEEYILYTEHHYLYEREHRGKFELYLR
jgi:hypothetical protein